MNVLVGKGQGSSVSASGRVLETVSEADSKEAIERGGGKLGCRLVRYARSVAVQQLDGYDIQELNDLVFGQIQLPRCASRTARVIG